MPLSNKVDLGGILGSISRSLLNTIQNYIHNLKRVKSHIQKGQMQIRKQKIRQASEWSQGKRYSSKKVQDKANRIILKSMQSLKFKYWVKIFWIIWSQLIIPIYFFGIKMSRLGKGLLFVPFLINSLQNLSTSPYFGDTGLLCTDFLGQ